MKKPVDTIKILEEMKDRIKEACECSLTSGSEKIQWNNEVQAIENALKEIAELMVIRKFIINKNLWDELVETDQWNDFIEKLYNTKEN